MESPPVNPSRLRVERMGCVPYGPMLALQEIRHAQILAGHSDDTLFLLEHPPVVTAGRNTVPGHLRISEAELNAQGIDFFATHRGGDVTYHGPGQRVGYLLIRLKTSEQDVKRFVFNLEEVVIRTALDYGVQAHRIEGLRGVWVQNAKLAAIGVRLVQWTTLHGFALNVHADLSGFKWIVPCGLHGRDVTSLAQLLGYAPDLHGVEDRLIAHSAHVFKRTAYAALPTPLPAEVDSPEGSCQASLNAPNVLREIHV